MHARKPWRRDTSTRAHVRGSRHVGAGGWRLGSALVVVLLVAATAGCTKHSPAPGPTQSLSIPPQIISSPPASSAVPASPEAAVLPRGCPQLLPLATVQQALGVTLKGKVTYLRAAPVPKSGRTGRVTCGYGTPIAASPAQPPTSTSASGGAAASSAPDAKPLVEVSYITYTDAKTAAGRVALTVSVDGKTSTVTKATVAGKPAYVLIGKPWDELLMADGARTFVVEVSPTVISDSQASAALTTMAVAMLSFGAPAASASASPS